MRYLDITLSAVACGFRFFLMTKVEGSDAGKKTSFEAFTFEAAARTRIGWLLNEATSRRGEHTYHRFGRPDVAFENRPA